MVRAILLAALLAVLPAAAGAADCDAMFRDIGAPAYKGTPPPHEILCREGYVLSHNGDTKVPDWVLELLTPDRITGRADRNALGNPFKPDPDLAAGQKPHAVLKDYRKSGCDRGHMAPAADMKWSDPAMIESFFLSNMAPQEGPQFNRGIWADLEDQTRRWIDERDRLVVISGPIYDDTARDSDLASRVKVSSHCQKEMIGDDVRVPTQFYKIVYSPTRNRVVAFVLPNRRLKGMDVADFRASVRGIEELTGLDFFTKLSARRQETLEARKKPMWRH